MIGELISGRYRIKSRIGSGGAGDVYLAEDTELPRQIALKFLSEAWEDDRHLRERFLRETEALSALDHPHICTIYEAGESERGHLYIAMAYYEGENLRTRLTHGALAPAEAVSIAIAIADGMDKAHRKGFLHRDLKPGNVVITDDGVVKILDFGLVRSPDRTQLTQTGVAMGTLAYAAPEQIRGERLDARSDVYALGVMLYQMLSGKCPYSAPGAAATISMVLNETPPPLSETNPDLPRALTDLIARCMSKKRRHRPESMAEVRSGLVEVLTELSPSHAARVRAEHVEHEEAGPARRRPWVRIAAGAVLAVALGVAVWSMIPPSATEDPGIAVIGIESGNDAQLAAGLQAELTNQVVRVAARHPRRWVLPASYLESNDPALAAERYGLRDLITGRVDVGSNGVSVTLTRRDAQSLDVTLSQSWSLPDSARASPDFGAWLAGALEIELSVEELAALAVPDTKSVPVWLAYVRGLGLMATDPESAIAQLEDVLERDPGFWPAQLGLAKAMIVKLEGDDDDSQASQVQTMLDALVKDELLRGEVHELQARLARLRGDAGNAADFYRLAMLRLPSNPEYRRHQWSIWYSEGAGETAEAAAQAGIEAHPGFYGSWEDLSYLAYMDGRYEEAIEQLEVAVRLAPTHERAVNNLGAFYFFLDRWEDGIALFEKSFEIDRRNYPAISNLGTLYYLTGQYERAADMQELAIEYGSESHLAVGNYAAALRWIPGQNAEYEQALARARELVEHQLEQRPDDPILLSFQAGYYVDVDTTRALALAERATRLAPEDADIAYRAAVTNEEAGRRSRALAHLGTAMELGCSMRLIASEPLLVNLRADPRYEFLIQ